MTDLSIEKRAIARNTVYSAGAKILQLASSFVFMPWLLRRFGLANYGIFLLAGSVSVYLGLLDFGVGSAVTKFVAEHRVRGENEELGRVVSNVTAYYSAIGVLAFLLLVAFAQFGVGLFHLSGADLGLARSLFMASAVIALLAWPLSIGYSVLAGIQRYDLSARIGVAVMLGNLIVTAGVLILRLGPLSLLASMGVVSVLGGLASVAAAWRQLGAAVPRSIHLVDRATLTRVFSFSWSVFVIQLTALVTDVQTDRLVLAAFVGPAAIGLYEAAAKLHGLIAQLAPLPTSALVPAASHLNAHERPEALRALFLRGTKYTVGFVVPIAVTLMILARPLLTHWLGSDFASMAPAAQAFLSMWVFFPNLTVAFSILIGTGNMRFLVRLNIVQAVLNLALSLILVQRFGVLGVIIGTVATDLALYPIALRYILGTLHVSWAEYVHAVVARTYPLLVAPVVVSWAAIALGLTGTLLGVAVTGMASAAAYWVALYLLGLADDERADVRALLASVTRRSAAG